MMKLNILFSLLLNFRENLKTYFSFGYKSMFFQRLYSQGCSSPETYISFISCWNEILETLNLEMINSGVNNTRMYFQGETPTWMSACPRPQNLSFLDLEFLSSGRQMRKDMYVSHGQQFLQCSFVKRHDSNKKNKFWIFHEFPRKCSENKIFNFICSKGRD